VFVPAVRDTNNKGNAAELAIAAEAAKLGLPVFAPLTEHGRYDLVLEVAGRLLRVQCKWGACNGETISVRLSSSYHSPTRGYVVRKYTAEEVDAIGVYCDRTRRCYLVPIEHVAGVGRLTLRLTPARNNQRAALNFAVEYEFRGAVAQLEERLTGSQEVTGSSPVSSTHDSDLGDTVGMDEFYARLAHYVRYAEQGGEITVTRWGRPVASIGPARHPATLKVPMVAADG
jgi:prevent-host-death family protein